ncbi:aldo/keto reductase [Streptomyces griseoluteus]|uniref:aldo/keto reductase n=1 Tax=Streptomyces griseoluteus TaxID=29306 RepID=UPI0037032345
MALDHVLPGRIGLGTAPLGNMFRAVSDEEVSATLDAAWDQGIRYYDSAPLYGAGLAEIRLGELLSHKPRDEFVLSSKVGRVILDEVESGGRDLGDKGDLFAHGRPNKILHDWTADATERSIEGSLERLGVDRLDIVWVHDIAQDFLQFSRAHPVSDAVIPGATKPSRISEDLAALREDIPVGFWRELREAGLVSPLAPLPGGA